MDVTTSVALHSRTRGECHNDDNIGCVDDRDPRGLRGAVYSGVEMRIPLVFIGRDGEGIDEVGSV